eukprot:gene1886-2223_t
MPNGSLFENEIAQLLSRLLITLLDYVRVARVELGPNNYRQLFELIYSDTSSSSSSSGSHAQEGLWYSSNTDAQGSGNSKRSSARVEGTSCRLDILRALSSHVREVKVKFQHQDAVHYCTLILSHLNRPDRGNDPDTSRPDDTTPVDGDSVHTVEMFSVTLLVTVLCERVELEEGDYVERVVFTQFVCSLVRAIESLRLYYTDFWVIHENLSAWLDGMLVWITRVPDNVLPEEKREVQLIYSELVDNGTLYLTLGDIYGRMYNLPFNSSTDELANDKWLRLWSAELSMARPEGPMTVRQGARALQSASAVEVLRVFHVLKKYEENALCPKNQLKSIYNSLYHWESSRGENCSDNSEESTDSGPEKRFDFLIQTETPERLDYNILEQLFPTKLDVVYFLTTCIPNGRTFTGPVASVARAESSGPHTVDFGKRGAPQQRNQESIPTPSAHSLSTPEQIRFFYLCYCKNTVQEVVRRIMDVLECSYNPTIINGSDKSENLAVLYANEFVVNLEYHGATYWNESYLYATGSAEWRRCLQIALRKLGRGSYRLLQ